MKKQTCQTTSAAENLDLAKKILSNLRSARLITLSGELGSGKTTFTQQLGKALDIKQKINSPTFVLMKLYKLPRQKKNIKFLCHVDLYRTRKSSLSNLNEYLNSDEVLTVIEWPDKIKKLPKPRVELNFTILDNKTRKISIVPKL